MGLTMKWAYLVCLSAAACNGQVNLGSSDGGAPPPRRCPAATNDQSATSGTGSPEADGGPNAMYGVVADPSPSGTLGESGDCDAGAGTATFNQGVTGGGTVSSGFASADGGGFVDPADCKSQCSTAAIFGCNVDVSVAQAECQALCTSSPTRDELTCVTDAPCAVLVPALSSGGSICDIAGQSDGG